MTTTNHISVQPSITQTNGFKPTIAYLGPEGTYSHQVAFDRYGESARYIGKSTIADVFHTIPTEATYAVIPKENSIFGPVIETYDLLRDPEVGKSVYITEEITFQIQHCLLVVEGTSLDDIKHIFSHEQALGQCSSFFSTFLPNATRMKTSSTAAAAEAILDEKFCRNSAAVCSEVCTKVFPRLKVLRKGIQNDTNNYTRFFVTTATPNHTTNAERKKALLRVYRTTSVSPDPSGLGEMISQIQIPVRQIDRRPLASSETPFNDVYFITVSRGEGPSLNWYEEVQQAVERLRHLDWEVCVLGWW